MGTQTRSHESWVFALLVQLPCFSSHGKLPLYRFLFKLLNGVSGYPKHLISVDSVEWYLLKARKDMGEPILPKVKHIQICI